MYEPKTETFMPALAAPEFMEQMFPLPAAETLDDQERSAYGYVTARSRRFFYSVPANADREYKLTPYYRVLLQSPRVAEFWAGGADFFQTAHDRGSYSNRARDLVQQALVPVLDEQIGRPTQNPVLPIAYAIESGIAPTDILAIWDGRLEELAEDDRRMVELAQAVARGTLTRELFTGVAELMGTKAAVEYVSFVGYKIASLRMMDAVAGIEQMEPNRAEAREFVQAHADGLAKPLTYGSGTSWVQPKST